MVTRLCLGCGTPTTRGSRCKDCRKQQRKKYQGDWPAHSARLIGQHRAEYGEWCPGYLTDAHPSSDLTVDHGPPEQVMCRACNSRKKQLGHG